ncbi:MAG TPA: alpha/beta hydrolase-fold protein [Prosthecobacter sp.]
MKLLPALLLLLCGCLVAAEPEFPLTEDSKPQAGVAKGTIIKDKYIAGERSVFPGTEREYQIYLPDGFAKNGEQPAPFMVFQDGVVYQAPVVFDNLIAKKDIPPLIGIFIRPGVVPAAHENALPRFNRSHEYDSVTDDYSRFLIEEFLPAIEKKHRFKLSTNGDHAAISGNSSGGICAFVAAWHRPDRFRRVFTGVGTYVGIHGADRFPVLLRKMEPKPLRVFLQSGTQDNNLYCGDWWMANQMMERSLAWAGYDVNHAWGEGGHNQKHASQVFPDAMRWLWRGWQTDMAIKANANGESKWKGYEVLAEGGWTQEGVSFQTPRMAAMADGSVYGIKKDASTNDFTAFTRLDPSGKAQDVQVPLTGIETFTAGPDGDLRVFIGPRSQGAVPKIVHVSAAGQVLREISFDDKDPDIGPAFPNPKGFCSNSSGQIFFSDRGDALVGRVTPSGEYAYLHGQELQSEVLGSSSHAICLSPDQTLLYVGDHKTVQCFQLQPGARPFAYGQPFDHLETVPWAPGLEEPAAMCVDTDGRLYVATSLGVQVFDQAGRVNFVIPTPGSANEICFAGKDLSELYIVCGDRVFKRPMKVRGVVSGQQAPVKPAPPKL